jgi:peptide/nickel transport system permease protein
VTAYLARRLLYSLFVLWGAVTIVFVAVRLVPGDPALLMLGTDASAEQINQLRQQLGLNEPPPLQYLHYLGDAARLDFGASLRLGAPAMGEVVSRLPATAQLTAVALVLALLVSFPLGILGAIRYRTPADGAVSLFSLLGQSAPNFWIGIMFILLFARQLRLLPSAGAGMWQNLVLPAATLALPLMGVLTRLVRSGLLDVLTEDYVRTGHAKGLPRANVLVRHAMPNMLIPVITVLGLQLGSLLGGTVIVETVFAWPGVGRLLVDSIANRDYPVVQAAVVVATGAFILINLAVDVSYSYLDPRIRFS